MHDCKIPLNVQKRRSELTYFSDALTHLKSSFDDMIQFDEAVSCSNQSKAAIGQLRSAIQP
jgi:hypothetical protein